MGDLLYYTMNYFNPLAVLNPEETNLSTKSVDQITDYKEFIRPRFEGLVKGELAKQEIARFYLEQEKDYTDDCKNFIDKINEGIGISKGYLSQLRTADKFVASLPAGIDGKCLKAFVSQN